ncbi:MAG: N-acetyl sugar amidotransferase [Microthrixaceae bacterium]|nr:N-acetyl sugar amidotransferase [Microthrixaceae bacterium]
MIRYCRRCVMPETKPDILFDADGVCSACNHYAARAEVDWDARRSELLEIVTRYRSSSPSNYDCVVPVSGGKDSTFQVVRVLELGLTPICVTSTTCRLTDLGRRNLDNLHRLGVDSIEMTPNPRVRRKLNRIGLREVGDISWPEHVGIFTTPVRTAVQMRVPLIVWGENSQNEYGGPAAAAADNTLTRRWLEEFGGLLGLRVSDMDGVDGLTERDLIPYSYPTDEELAEVGVTGIFLGHYLPWDGWANQVIAQAHGFETYPTFVEGSLVNYENLDNAFNGIHDYFKFLKFGFGRATDLACMMIRRGRLARADAIELVRRHDGVFPATHLGISLEEILEDLDISIDEFVAICDRFTNRRLFETDRQGELIKDRHGNLTKVNFDNVPAT